MKCLLALEPLHTPAPRLLCCGSCWTAACYAIDGVHLSLAASTILSEGGRSKTTQRMRGALPAPTDPPPFNEDGDRRP